MSKYKLYVPENASWSEILTEYQLTTAISPLQASIIDTQSDLSTLTTTVNEHVDTLQSQINSIDRTIVFGIDGIVEQGIKTVHITSPFTSTVKEIHASIGSISGADIEVVIETSSDYIEWNPIQSLSILVGAYEISLPTFTTPIVIDKGEKYRVRVASSIDDVQNLSVNVTVE